MVTAKSCGEAAGLLGDSGLAAARDLWAVALRPRAPPSVTCPATGRQAAPGRNGSAVPRPHG
jgi:hypothetical protein